MVVLQRCALITASGDNCASIPPNAAFPFCHKLKDVIDNACPRTVEVAYRFGWPRSNHGTIQEEDATGRFHASLAFTRQAFEQVGGWPLTLRGDFDQQLIA